jgi:hypothetical protein
MLASAAAMLAESDALLITRKVFAAARRHPCTIAVVKTQLAGTISSACPPLRAHSHRSHLFAATGARSLARRR